MSNYPKRKELETDPLLSAIGIKPILIRIDLLANRSSPLGHLSFLSGLPFYVAFLAS